MRTIKQLYLATTQPKVDTKVEPHQCTIDTSGTKGWVYLIINGEHRWISRRSALELAQAMKEVAQAVEPLKPFRVEINGVLVGWAETEEEVKVTEEKD